MEVNMKRFSFCILVFLAVVFLAAVSCPFAESGAESPATESLTLMTWNVHNLFDGLDNGFEYNEFLISSGWSMEKYLGRINTLSAAIARIEPLPDIIVLQEIESLQVIQDLAGSVYRGYVWSHFANNPGAALGLGIMSRFPISDTRIHSITAGSDTTPRPVLETRIQAGQGEFVIFSCHWKSKLGGDDATEGTRRAAARVILRRIREIWNEEPELGILVAGDLNINHDDFYRRSASIICALLPDDPYCAMFTGCIGADGEEYPGRQKDFFILSKNKPPVPVYFPQGTIVFYSPWMEELENGTYFFRNKWETIDHFLLSRQFFNNTGWVYKSSQVINYPPFTRADGIPFAYNPRTGSGLSDHLPLLLHLRMILNE
jgi:endonuclease/exonuclease/phosphatase family metal-dependent hydrolase